MKRWPCAAFVIIASGCTSDSTSPAAAGPVNIVIDAGVPGAAKLRIVGPGPGAANMTNVPASIYAMAEAQGDTLTVLLFGDGLAGSVGMVSLPDGAHPERYHVTVVEAADSLNRPVEPGAVHVRLVGGGGQ